ncbi:DinB family protein [Tamlana fucoidanivorans]|uniref:DinB family protein n=1 Tax=Allotamlana fucoidanivorans TaxID=2583814 RepID=A0A5C4SEZ8_9FLAO|nr:DinB family protein [Tamlana fucoidanivorans]TNJ42132.1 DinB family protein [Tamlana fucoidanivorans]
MKVSDLNSSEYNSYYQGYIESVSAERSLIDNFKVSGEGVLYFFKRIPESKWNFKYHVDKWSVKEVFQHIIDTERVFIYRCFRIARHDNTPLAGFNQDDYIAPSKANEKSMEQLLEEYEAVRKNSIVCLQSINETDLKFVGYASGAIMSARAAAFIILGHEAHHLNVLKSKYQIDWH